MGSHNRADVEKYGGTAGMATKFWGPGAWRFLFSNVMGAYPVKLDLRKREHKLIKKHFKQLFESLPYTIGCVFCRQSFKQFITEIPLKEFMGTRLDMMFWLYSMKDKVNRKLIQQERARYMEEKTKLVQMVQQGNITVSEYSMRKEAARKDILYTERSPPFERVLDFYEGFRAKCSKKLQTCSS